MSQRSETVSTLQLRGLAWDERQLANALVEDVVDNPEGAAWALVVLASLCGVTLDKAKGDNMGQ